MASWGQMSAQSRAVVGVGGAVAVAVVGLLAWWFTQTPPAPPPPPAPVAAPVEPAAVADPAPTPAPEPLPVAAPPEPPGFDLVRVEADGAAQVAGRGAAGSLMVLLVDGAPVAETPVASDGSFVALFTLAPNPLPSLLSLLMRLPDGTEVPGRDTVAIAPITGPVIAAVTPEVTTAVPPAPVPAPAPPAALLVTDAGVKVLQTPQPAAVSPASVTIDTIAYTPDGAVQFGGRGAVAQLVRLYLDNADLAETVVPDGGQWALTSAGIAPGIYTLRADQLDRDGKVTSRFETPFKRETIAALEVAAAPQAPAPVPEPAPGPTPEPVLAPLAPVAPAPLAAVAPAPAPEVVQLADPTAEPAPGPTPEPVLAPLAPAAPQPVPASAPEVAQLAEPAPAPAPVAAPQPAALAPEAAPAVVAVADPAAAPRPDPAPVAAKPPVSITVQPGLTLWAIAEDRFGHGIMYVQVYEANKDKIRDPDLIYPGQVFTVPVEP